MNAEHERAGRIAALGYAYAERELEPVAACNLCGAAESVEVSRTDRYGYAARFVVCCRCGLGYLAPRLTAAEYADFYRDVYRPLVSAYHGRLIDAVTVQEEQRDYAAELVDFLRASLLGAPGSVLDVGGSTGVVAGAVGAAFGTAATVLDPAPDELAQAAAAGMETIAGFAEDFDRGDRRWDLVLLCQTIDHLLDVRATLEALRAAVADDGALYVDALDVGFMAQRRCSVEGAIKIDHPYYLTRETARAYLAVTGFAVVAERMSHDGHWGFLARPADALAPDWSALGSARERFLRDVWRLRAGG